MGSIDLLKLIDLTHPLDGGMVHWPGDRAFVRREEAAGRTPAGYWYALGSFETSEHAGTHIDAPVHFGEGQATIDELPATRLIAPAAVIDVSAACADETDYELSRSDIAAWEASNGALRAGSLMLVRTGWAQYWLDHARYMGTTSLDDAGGFHFPGLAPEAAEWLVERRIRGAGIDTASLDHGPSIDFRAHRILHEAGIYSLENLTNLHLLPATGATVIALPIKIRGGSGAPARVVAILPKQDPVHLRRARGGSGPGAGS